MSKKWESVSGTSKCTCPFCNLAIAGIMVYKISKTGHNGQTTEYYVLRCPLCDSPIIHKLNGESFPACKPFQSVKHVPDNISDLYEECRTALGNACYTASIMVARTLIMYIAVDQGANGNKSFAYYVDYISEKNLVPPNAKQWIDSIRKLGNNATHCIENRTKEEAELAIKFLMYLMILVYELPNEI